MKKQLILLVLCFFAFGAQSAEISKEKEIKRPDISDYEPMIK